MHRAISTTRRRYDARHIGARPASTVRAAFTLVEWMVVLLITSVLLSLSAFAFTGVARSTVLARAENALVTYAELARTYAIANRIETMMVVNPFNGRFELWHANPSAQGGPWDPLSGGSPGLDPENTDGYAFAPVFDSGARLPLDGDQRPTVAVHPIDYDQRPITFGGSNNQLLDNLTYAAVCFDANGRLVIRTRRIATRTFLFRDGTARSDLERNRLRDESPDLARNPLVWNVDTPITSTKGFVITNRTAMEAAIGANPTPPQIVNNWLILNQPPNPLARHSRRILFNRFTGQSLGDLF